MTRTRQYTRTVHGRRVRLRLDEAPVLIGSRIARFRDPAHRAELLPPFPALVRAPVTTGPAPRDFPVTPLFADAARRRTIVVEGEPGTSYYGTGEVSGPLERSGRRVVCWNADCFGYDDKAPSLYQSHPWVLAVRRDGNAYGVMVETTHRCRITTGRGIVFECEGHSPGVIVIDGDSPQDVVKELAVLTGYMPMPPKWALGYQQCRWSYEPESRVREIAAEFRARKIPCDVIWLDIDYMDGFRCFTFDREKFPDPARLFADLHAQGFRVVCMIDPGIKVDPAYSVYAAGRRGGHFVSTRDGAEYHGKVWPGDCAFPDFTNARAREWWAGLFKDFMANGIDGVWNDMNEPAVFDGPGKTMPETNRHDADAELGGAGGDRSRADHARHHNLYGMQMVRATREGIERARPGTRPFVLTRSSFLGGQRYAATWTGDNTSDRNHLRWSIPMVLNLGLSGQPFCGPDIGGFIGNATPELFARWMGIGALLPFARGHSTKDSKDHEPWSFGEECERAGRAALERRYRLMPYLYTVFHEAHATGLPVARPAFFADPRDPYLRAVEDAFLLGESVLAVADTIGRGAPQRILSGVFERWREFEPAAEKIDELPRLFIRPGAIVPLGPVMQRVDEKPLDTLTLIVNPHERGNAAGMMYEDTGDGEVDGAGSSMTRLVYENGAARAEPLRGQGRTASRAIETVVVG